MMAYFPPVSAVCAPHNLIELLRTTHCLSSACGGFGLWSAMT